MTLTSPTHRRSDNYISTICKAASTLLLLLSISFLAGCAGLSAGPRTSTTTEQPGSLSLSGNSLDFGSVVVGATKPLSITVVNNGSQSVTVSAISLSSNNFAVTAPTFPATVAVGQSATVTVAFTPNAAGPFSATATISSNAANSSVSVSLSGTGITSGDLAGNPSSQAFGNVVVGSQQTVSETITNNGGSSVTISQAAATGTGFSITGISAPVTVAAGQSTTFSVTFAPKAAGSASGNITLTSDASNSTLAIPLSGTGIAAGQLASNPSSESFGNITLGMQKSASATVTNNGGASVTISKATVSGTGFTLSGISTPVSLGAGQSTTLTVTFTPQSAGSASGNVTLTSNASNSTLTIPLSGTGVAAGQLTANPTSQSFGSVTVGSQKTLSQSVTNTGGTSVTISQAVASGSGFTLSGISTPITLAAGKSASFSVIFAPQANGSASGSVTITSDAPNPTLTIPLSGTGASPQAGTLTVSPATLALGSVAVGDSGTASGSLSASGASVTVTAATTNNSVFTVSGLSLPVTIPAGNSVPFTITFSPQTAGSVNATLTVTSNAQSTTTTEALTGTGTAQSHQVVLSWTGSTSTDVSGYNVYRATFASSACGSFAKINPALLTNTAYNDAAVASGVIYCYTTTAVDTNNTESSFSNIVANVVIP